MAWIFENGKLTNTEFIGGYEKSIEKPYPMALWRIEPNVNSGLPYHELMPDFLPVHYTPVPQYDYIIAYDMANSQFDFDNNGLAVLHPISCRVTEVLNGSYSVTLEHIVDEMSQYILEWNHIKVGDQLFTIKKTDSDYQRKNGKITAYAEHISYQLNDAHIFPEISITGNNGNELIANILANADYNPDPNQTIYLMNGQSDIEFDYDFSKWANRSQGCTPMELLLGSDGFIANLGGKLYRDNFYFSINSRMEGAVENSFDIRVGHNLKGIKRTVDISTFCSYFRGYDQYGQWFAVAWDSTTLPRAFPHNVVRSQNFNVENFDELEREVMKYFGLYCAPLVSFTFSIKDLKNNPDFQEFSNNPRYKVGDTGRVFDERIGGYMMLEITKTVKDGITGETLEFTVGNTRSFVRPSGYNSAIISGFDYTPQGGKVQFKDKNGKLLFAKNHVKLVKRVI